ncbi:MAG: hypothetical protein WC881_08160 [Elusimicrobiota bacterium]
MKNMLRAAAVALCGLAAGGCQAPKYALYISAERDFQCRVPWAWNVMFDAEDKHFNNTTFIGPFEPDFYLGAPSLSVRWYSRYQAHRLRDGSVEMYADADDYINQTLEGVYGKDRVMIDPVREVAAAGRRAKHFVVLSAGPAAAGARWGTARDKITGRVVDPRQHAYVVLPMPGGFYVLIYPATPDGFDKYEPQFNQLVNSFTPLKSGPGGAPLQPSAARKAGRS